MNTRLGRLIAITLLIFSPCGPVRADDAPAARTWRGTLQRPDGQSAQGSLAGDAPSGFTFRADGVDSPTRLEIGSVISFEGQAPAPSAVAFPFRVDLGLNRRISGRLGRVSENGVQLEESSTGRSLTVSRGGIRSIVQRIGEVQVLEDGFESLTSGRWTVIGDAEIADEPRVGGQHSLRLPAGGSSVTCHLAMPLSSGRVEVAVHDGGEMVGGQQWFADLLFRGPAGPETVRVVFGWSEESLSVESPGGPALAVQRLERRVGWRRLAIRVGPTQTQIAVDGNTLAHGKGTGGPLVEIRLASHTSGNSRPPANLAAHFDDLRVVRFAEPVSGLEIDPTQDEVRLAAGDQVFGTLRDADSSRIELMVDTQEVTLPWSEVSGIHLKRVASQSEPVEGLLVRVDWQAAPGHEPRDLDRVDGALTRLTAEELTLETPYAGRLSLRLGSLRRLEVLGRGRRIVLDATGHHLGNQIVGGLEPLDPPQPEGGALVRPFELMSVPAGPAYLTFDVLQVAGEASGLRFADLVKKGEARTKVRVNGREIDYLNRHITSKNETPERIRIPIPSGLLHQGRNLLRLEQVGTALDPSDFDDLGLLEIALEFSLEPSAPSVPSNP